MKLPHETLAGSILAGLALTAVLLALARVLGAGA